jgi:DNA-binding SARP family transcriptional activator
LDFRILGPLEAREGDRDVPLGGGKQRAVLALLLVNANSTVSIDSMVDGLWGDEVPESAQKMVQIYVYCGAARRWPSSQPSRSRSPRAHGSRSSASQRSNCGSRPTSHSAVTGPS